MRTHVFIHILMLRLDLASPLCLQEACRIQCQSSWKTTLLQVLLATKLMTASQQITKQELPRPRRGQFQANHQLT